MDAPGFRTLLAPGLILLAAATSTVGLDAQELRDPEVWNRALAEVERLPPTAFPDLPDRVRRRLEEHDCRIPQGWDGWGMPRPHNVIQGAFAAAGGEDWAALCTRNDTSRIVVVWEEGMPCPAEVAAAPDRGWLQGVGGGTIGYSRVISPAGRARIRRLHDAFGGPEPPPGEHQGISDAFAGKASTILYCHQGRWVLLTGMD